MIDKLIERFADLEDPRFPGKVERRLTDIPAIAICAVIACAESWEDIAQYGRSKLPWLRQFLALPDGIPAHGTFRRVCVPVGPPAFEVRFTARVGALAPPVAPGEPEVAAIGGKTSRGPFDRGRAVAAASGRRVGQRARRWASAALTTSPTKSRPCPNCWTG